MSAIIINEYQELLLKKNEIEQTLPSLPEGYISTKTIKEKQYYYLQNRMDGQIYYSAGEFQIIQFAKYDDILRINMVKDYVEFPY